MERCSLGKGFAVQARGPEFRWPEPVLRKKKVGVWQCMPVTPALVGQSQLDPGGLLASQSSQNVS